MSFPEVTCKMGSLSFSAVPAFPYCRWTLRLNFICYLSFYINLDSFIDIIFLVPVGILLFKPFWQGYQFVGQSDILGYLMLPSYHTPVFSGAFLYIRYEFKKTKKSVLYLKYKIDCHWELLLDGYILRTIAKIYEKLLYNSYFLGRNAQ